MKYWSESKIKRKLLTTLWNRHMSVMEDVIFGMLGGIQQAEQFKEWECRVRLTISQFTGSCVTTCLITIDIMGVKAFAFTWAMKNTHFSFPHKSRHLKSFPKYSGWLDNTMSVFKWKPPDLIYNHQINHVCILSILHTQGNITYTKASGNKYGNMSAFAIS